MYPVAIGALVTRVTSVARTAAPVLASATARLRSLGVAVGSKVDDLIAWAKASPANASLLAMTLASLGVSMADVFESEEGKEAASKVEIGKTGLASIAKVLEAGSVSEKLNLQIAENAADAFTAIEVLRFARSHYGSQREAVRGHMLHQAFFEMPLNDVEIGFETLRI